MDDIDRLTSKKTGFVHTVRKDGIEFRFSLLNEQGEPAVTFREGENLALHFEMENLREGDKREYFVQLFGYMHTEGSLGNVYSSNGELVASFFSDGGGCDKVLASYPFDKNNLLAVTFPWKDNQRDEWTRYLSCYFKGNPSYILPKGAYSTGFTYTFEYRISPKTWVEVGPVTMKIDFTIE
jgi:hypothetical protein